MDSTYKSFVEAVEKKLHRKPTIEDLVEESLCRCMSSDQWIEMLKEMKLYCDSIMGLNENKKQKT